MAFTGNLKGWGISEMLQLVRVGRKTGALVVEADEAAGGPAGGGRITLYFRNGMAIGVDTGVDEELGAILLQNGSITKSDLDQAISLQKNRLKGRRIEQILLAAKRVDPRKLALALRRQIERTLTDLLQMKGGRVSFEADAAPRASALANGVDVQNLLLSSAVIADEWGVIREKIPSLAVIPSRTPKGQEAMRDIALKLDEWKVWLAIDGEKDLRSIINKTRLDEFVATKALFLFLTEGWMELIEQADPRPTILVVDDSLTIQKMIELALAETGYNLITATDGATAMKVAQEERLDLILLDVMLPDTTGYKVCRQVRSLSDKHKRIPIMMLTAKDAEIDRNLGKYAGADDYMTKPFETEELLNRVQMHLNRVPEPAA